MSPFHLRKITAGGCLGLSFLLAVPAFAVDGLQYHITPIVGFDHITRTDPEPYGKWRVVYGAGVTAGYRIMSAEGEVTHASDSETFPLQGIADNFQEDRIKIGLRSEYDLTTLLASYVRLGGQGSRSKRDRTLSGSTSTQWDPWILRPYVGTGLKVKVGSNLNLSAGATVVFRNFPKMDQNEVQTDFGLEIHLGHAGR